MGDLDGLQGREYGPVALAVAPDRVHAFAAATGDDPARWERHAPPLFANAALFTAAPRFLADPEVAPFTRSLIHSTQEYTWMRPLPVGETIAVTGRVEAVRARGALHFVTFSVAAGSDSAPWVTGSALFLLSADAAAAAPDEPEPAVALRPPVDGPATTGALPVDGAPLPEYRCGASRSDLVRYAAATGDWNPIHWDHESARGAGLPGTIVHGLLMAAWMANAVSRLTTGPDPLRALEVRFRNPLRPGVPAVVTGSAGAEPGWFDLALSASAEKLVTGRIRVTP